MLCFLVTSVLRFAFCLITGNFYQCLCDRSPLTSFILFVLIIEMIQWPIWILSRLVERVPGQHLLFCLPFADFRQAHPFHVVVQTWSMPTIYIFSSEHILAQSSNKDLRIMYLTLFLVPHYCLWNSDLSLDVFTFEYSPLYKLAQPMFSVKIPAIFFLQLP